MDARQREAFESWLYSGQTAFDPLVMSEREILIATSAWQAGAAQRSPGRASKQVYSYRRKGISRVFTTCDKSKFDELSAKPHLFEMRIFYDASQPVELANVSQEPVGEAGSMPGTTGFTMACFPAEVVPLGTKIYIRPQSA